MIAIKPVFIVIIRFLPLPFQALGGIVLIKKNSDLKDTQISDTSAPEAQAGRK